MVAYVPGLSGAAFTPRWALLSAVVPMLAAFTECRAFTVAHAFGTALLAWCAVTLIWAADLWDGLDALWKLALFACLFHIGAALPSLRPVYIGAGLGIVVNGGFAVVQLLGVDLVYRIEGQTGMASGLFMNKTQLAEPAALVLIGLIGHRLWCLAALVLPAVALPMARSPLVALTSVTGVSLWRTSAYAVVMVLVAAAIVFLAWSPNVVSINERLIIWYATFDNLAWFGHGIGSFYTLFPSHAQAWDFMISRPAHAHNDWLELAYETGLPGALLASGFLVLVLCGKWRTEYFIVLAFVIEACFGFPLHYPATVFLAALAAGYACRGRDSLCYLLRRRRMALCRGVERVAAAG